MKIIKEPSVVSAAGDIPKIIEEYVGRVNTGSEEISIAKMKSPSGWSEPGQTPEFNEYTLILSGRLTVETREETHTVSAGQAFIADAGEWVRYSSPGEDGAEYVAVCLPAFSPDTVNRDE